MNETARLMPERDVREIEAMILKLSQLLREVEVEDGNEQ